MKFKELPPVEVLRDLLDYDPDCGEVRFRKSRGSRKKGDVAGTANNKGYLCIKVNNSNYYLHRIVWALHYGTEPPNSEIDHIDRNRTNNRINNLRLVTRSENCMNRGLNRNNTSGHTGVSYCKRDKLWVAKIKKHCIGYYKTMEEAIVARKQFTMGTDRAIWITL